MTLPAAAPAAGCALRVQGLVTRYGSVVANDDVTLDVGAAEVFGVLGPNGAGKSTFVRTVMGLQRPSSGQVSLLGHDVVAHPARAAQLAAYLGQEDLTLADLTPLAAVTVTGRLRGLRRRAAADAARQLVDELGVVDADRPLSRLSGGQRRLVGVASALVGERPLLVLDEPTAGLDPVARRSVWAALERRRATGASVVLVTHNVLEAEAVLDRVAVFDSGRVIACGTPGELKASISDEVRLELVWRDAAPLGDAEVARLAGRATVAGRRWSAHLQTAEARRVLAHVTEGPVLAALDDFRLATPTLEDVYLALGGRAADDMERS